MSKILDVKDDIVQIGTDDGGIKEVRRVDVKFDAKPGDKVDIFENENSVIVTKKEDETKKEEISDQNPNGGVNININNTNTNANPNNGYVGNGKKVVNKWIYVLLAFFLGGLGAHKFYAGKNWCRRLLFLILLDMYTSIYSIYRIHNCNMCNTRCKWKYISIVN